MSEGTLWGLVDRDRVALPVAIVSAVWIWLVITAIGIVALSAFVLGTIADNREREEEMAMIALRGEASPETWYALTAEEAAAARASWNAQVVALRTRTRRPLPVTGTLAWTAMLVLALEAPFLLLGDRPLVWRTRARTTDVGECDEAKHGLAVVAIAMGMDMPPRLRIIGGGLNAFCVGRPGDARFTVYATESVTSLRPDIQRAIYANLMVRSQRRRSAWLTFVAPMIGIAWSFMGIWDWFSHFVRHGTTDQGSPQGRLWFSFGDVLVLLSLPLLAFALNDVSLLARGSAPMAVSLSIVVPVFVVALVTLPPIAWGVTLAQSRDARFGDSEGVLVTKEIAGMLDALSTTAEWDTYCLLPRQYGHLAWAWPGGRSSFASASIDRRWVRIREVAGVGGFDAESGDLPA